MYIIAYLLGISNEKYLRRIFWVINLKNCTSMSLAIELMYFSLVKFMPINLHHILNDYIHQI